MPGAPAAKDDPGGLTWVSRDATYEVSSIYHRYSPLPSLLTGQGQLHSVGSAKDCFAFHTSKDKEWRHPSDMGAAEGGKSRTA